MDRMALPEYEGMRIVARQDELAPFQWTAFYEAVGGKLLDYANDRRPLRGSRMTCSLRQRLPYRTGVCLMVVYGLPVIRSSGHMMRPWRSGVRPGT